MSAAGVTTQDRPLVAIVANVQTPYRLHLHARIAAEIPEIRLASLFTHEQGDQPWALRAPEGINPVMFGAGHVAASASSPRSAAREWTKGGAVVDWLARHRARAVVVHGYNDPGRLRLFAWCRRAGVPCLLAADSNVHADTAAGAKRALKAAVVRWVVRRCDAVLPCGRAGAAYYRRYGARDDRIFPFPYDPDYDAIRALPAAAVDDARARFGLDPARKRVLFCGRLVPVKRVDTAVDAFLRIAARRPDWDLLVVGDGPLRRELEARVPADLRPRVRFTGFVGDPAVIAALFRACHLYAHPASFEPWGIVVTEAAAAGLGLVCSAVTGAGVDLVRDGVNGRLAPVGDTDAWERALLEATEHDRWKAWGQASSAVLAEFRATSDPVAGLRRALASRGVIGAAERERMVERPLAAAGAGAGAA